MSIHKIAHLTSVHTRYDTRIFLKMCTSLAKDPEYKVYLVVADDLPDEEKNGVTIVSVGKTTGGRLSRMTRTVGRVYKKAMELDCDLYHFHDPELMPIGVKLKKRGKKVIYDVHEDARQQIMLKGYIPAILRKALSCIYARYEDYACRQFAALITPQEIMSQYYQKIKMTVTVENFVDLSLYPERKLDFTKPILLHAGALSDDRGLYNMVNAAKFLKGDFLFYVAGRLDGHVSPVSLSPLIYLGFLDPKSLVDAYRKSNIGVILYNNVGQYWMAGAVKCYEYMANSMPVLMPDFGEWVDFNRVHQCGINVDVQNAQSIAEAIHYLIDNPEKASELGRNGRRWVEERYSWQSAFRKLQSLYGQLLETPVSL
jgi:glycosyltransferase involved in cell wall biosynthesis